MKWIVYFLILANLAFALWHYRFQEKPAASIDQDETLRLVLLKEYLARQEEGAAAANQRGQAKANCYTLGPFKNKNDAAKVRDRMIAVGIEAKRRLDRNNTRKGFWVIIPPESTSKKAGQHIRKLKQKGIKDYFLVATGDYANAVSLGVYVNSDSAERRYEQMKKQGFNVRLQTVDLPVREYWIDWPQDQTLLPEVLDKFREEYSGIGQAERSCVVE